MNVNDSDRVCVTDCDDKTWKENFVKDYNEYHRRRLTEISDLMKHKLLLTKTRNEQIVEALRTVATRNADRESERQQKLLDVAAVTRIEMKTHNNLLMATVNTGKCLLKHFLEKLRLTNEQLSSSEEETAESLSEDMANLVKSMRLSRQKFGEVEADIRCVEGQLHRERGDNDRIKCRVIDPMAANEQFTT